MRHLLLLLFLLTLFCVSSAMAEEHPKWSGVDETVVEKFARDLGREPWDPFLDTDQGDLLLFLFTLAGAVGGFVMGYYWHKVFVAKMDLEQKER
jgi:cobalt/nickel transport protein